MIAFGVLLFAACAQVRRGREKGLVRLAGVWESSGKFQYTRMRIEADGSVDWYSSGSLETHEGKRSATLAGNSPRLSEPVLEYAATETAAFRYVLAAGHEYLVPDDYELELMRESKDPFDPDVWVGLRRRAQSYLE